MWKTFKDLLLSRLGIISQTIKHFLEIARGEVNNRVDEFVMCLKFRLFPMDETFVLETLSSEETVSCGVCVVCVVCGVWARGVCVLVC